jgi:hypothetical protein
MRRWLTTIFQRKPAQAVQAESMRLGNLDANHPYEVQVDHPLADVVSGMCFHATLQLRTPLRILKRNGQILPLGTDLPDDLEQWMGIWAPKTKTWTELGIDVAAADYESSASSHIGPVKPSEYLPFLVAIREVVEDRSLSLNDRKACIVALCSRPEFSEFAERHGGAEEIFSYFHPPILSVIPGLTAPATSVLRAMGLRTVDRIRQATDKELSSVKGLGPSKIGGIRAFCDSYRGDPNVEYRTEIE